MAKASAPQKEKELCGYCIKPVTNRQWALTCDECNRWIHVSSCSDETESRYSIRMRLKEELEIGFVCRVCYPNMIRRALPFQTLTNPAFKTLFPPIKIRKLVQVRSDEYVFPFSDVADLSELSGASTHIQTRANFNTMSILPFYTLSHQQLVFATTVTIERHDLPEASLDFLCKNKKSFNVVAMNCQSVRNKLSEIKELAIEGGISVFAITESWFTKSHKDTEVSIEGYSLYRTDRTPKQWGTLLYVKQGISVCRQYEKVNIPSDVFKIVKKGMRSFILVNNYRPCSSDEAWNTTYQSLLHSISVDFPGMSVYSMGDFNIDLKKSSSDTEKLLEISGCNGMMNLINKPTRITNDSSTIIDHFWTNDTDSVQKIDTFVGVSDHFGIAISINQNPSKNEHQIVTYRDTKHFNSELFAKAISLVPWQSSFVFEDVNDQYAHFCSLFNEIIDEHAPLKTTKIKPKQSHLPWMTPEIKAMIKTKNLLNKQSKADRTLVPLFKDMRRSVKKMLKQAENAYFETELKKTKGNSRKLWQVLNKSTGFRKARTSTTIDSAKTANAFNNYFTNVSTGVHNELQNTVDTFRLQPMQINEPEVEPPLFSLRMSEESDIRKIIDMLDPLKSVGHDNISSVFIRSANGTLSSVISQLVNNSIRSGMFPDDQKIAKVTPIHKKGEKDKPGNHRPVSVLPVISKIFERYIADRICDHVEGNGLVNLHQSGFRKHHGTHTALHHMVDNWATALGQKQCVAVLAIDLSKAFDCLHHDSILKSLNRLGIHDCNILKDYLNNRKQYVSASGITSELEKVLNGVPQGSILGPLLFILALSDIEQAIKDFLHMFADDITNWIIGRDWSEMKLKLEKLLLNLFTYLAFKGLRINMDKCHLMILGKQYLNVKSVTPLSLELFHEKIEEENDIKLLGVTIDKKLSFEKHIFELVGKCNQNIQFLWRSAKDRSEQHRRLLANALVMSHLNYCDTVYHRFLSQNLSNLLNSVQYKMLRFIVGVKSGQRVSLDTLCSKLEWLQLDKHRECKLLTLIWRTLAQDHIPRYMQSCIRINGTRTRFGSQSTLTLNEYGRHTINSVYCNTFIRLPLSIINVNSSELFLSRVQRYIR